MIMDMQIPMAPGISYVATDSLTVTKIGIISRTQKKAAFYPVQLSGRLAAEFMFISYVQQAIITSRVSSAVSIHVSSVATVKQ